MRVLKTATIRKHRTEGGMAKSEDQSDRALSIFLFILLIYFMSQALKVHFDLISAFGPLDPRENQLWMFTDLLARGKNPYDAQFLPAYVNVYGIAEPLVVLPFAKLFGDTLWLERIVSAVCLYTSAALLVVHSRRLGLTWLAALGIAGSMLMILINSLAVTAKIDAFGLLMAVSALVIPYRYGFQMRPLLLAAFLGVIAMFTKVYFAYGFIIAIGYAFLFVSMRRALLVGLAFVAMVILAAITITWAAPLYLNLTFGVAASIGSNLFSKSPILSALRLYYVVLNTWPLWVSAIACVGAYLLAPQTAIAPRILKPFGHAMRTFQLSNWSRGLFSTPFVDYATFAFIGGGVISLYLEMHGSGGRNYYYQMLLPIALPFLGVIVTRFNPLSRRWKRHAAAIASLATLAVVFFTADTPHRNFNPFPRGQDALQWAPLERALDGAKDVLHTPEVANLVRARKLPVYNAGSADFFLTDDEATPGAPMTAKKKMWEDFVSGIARKVEAKRFDAIFTWKGNGNFVSRQQIEAFYRIESVVPLQLGFYSLTIEIWRPK
jgi:hypothetical protein